MDANHAVLTPSPVCGDDSFSPWSRTVAVIRIPRFRLFPPLAKAPTAPDDALAAFAIEPESEIASRAL